MSRSPRVSRLWTAWCAARTLGVPWVCGRLWYEAQRKSGWLRRKTPAGGWQTEIDPPPALEPDRPPSTRLPGNHPAHPPFHKPAAELAAARQCFEPWDQAGGSPVGDADRVVEGELPYFNATWRAGGDAADWVKDPLTGKSLPNDCHWSQIPDFGEVDIKLIWEPSRFAALFPLVRAHARTGEARYLARTGRLIESWREGNPVNQGPNWMCGQETALRTIAWCFAGMAGAEGDAAGSSREVLPSLQMFQDNGRRIAANIGYALQQENNHGISEAAGLWTIGLLFPSLPASAAWQKQGRRWLERQADTLIYDDGSFSQHSFNYHRLMLDVYLWSIQLGRHVGEPLSDRLCQRVARSAELLYQLQDQATGRLPNYGQNDGAMALPLTNCDPRDFRPTLQTAWLLLRGERAYPPGPWDEHAWWLGALPTESALSTADGWQAPPRRDLQAPDGGYYTLRSPDGFLFTRTARFRHRPSQADLLHVDLWWRGQNIALDPGTYSYHQPAPWNNPLATTGVHNTVSVDDRDQMERPGRFLWLPWAKGRMLHQARDAQGPLAYWEGTHDGYTRLRPAVSHRRGILRLPDEYWLVLDQLASAGPHAYRLHWLLPAVPHALDETARQLLLETPAGKYSIAVGCENPASPLELSLVSADPGSPRGWQATSYLARQPALSLAARCRAATVRFWTLLGPGEINVNVNVSFTPTQATIQSARYTATVQLAGEAGPLIPSTAVAYQDGSAPATLGLLP